MNFAKNIALAGTVLVGSVVAANAALIDFTDPSSYTISGTTGSGTASGGVAYTLTATGGNFNNSEPGPGIGSGRTGPLTGIVDGLGIRDDEVTFPREQVNVTFAKSVQISALYFLDLFGTNPGGQAQVSDESVTVTTGNGTSQTFMAQTLNQDGTVGFGDFQGLTLTGKSFTFTPLAPNDAFAKPDFALAGIEAATVPLPAGVLLLGGALGGLGFARRFKKKAA